MAQSNEYEAKYIEYLKNKQIKKKENSKKMIKELEEISKRSREISKILRDDER